MHGQYRGNYQYHWYITGKVRRIWKRNLKSQLNLEKEATVAVMKKVIGAEGTSHLMPFSKRMETKKKRKLEKGI